MNIYATSNDNVTNLDRVDHVLDQEEPSKLADTAGGVFHDVVGQVVDAFLWQIDISLQVFPGCQIIQTNEHTPQCKTIQSHLSQIYMQGIIPMLNPAFGMCTFCFN